MKTYDAVFVGSGPACTFAAIELARNGYTNILILEQGVLRDDSGNVSLTSGFLGSGAFSDGKINYNHAVGTTTLPDIVGLKEYYEYLDCQEQMWLDFAPTQEQINTRLASNPNADTQISRFVPTEDAKKLRAKALAHNIELSTYPVRHLGSDNAYHITLNIYKYLTEKGVDIRFNHRVDEILKLENSFSVTTAENIKGTTYVETFESKNVMIGVGRSGSASFIRFMDQLGVPVSHGVVDLGVRVEAPDEIFAKIVSAGIYEPKFRYRSKTTDDSCRTFCYSDDTEVLTFDGFKLFKDIDKFTKFLSVAPNGNLEWLQATHKQELEYEGMMKHITSPVYDCLVTPDHTFAVRENWDNQYTFKEFNELKSTDCFSIECNWDADKLFLDSPINLNGFEISWEHYCEFMGYYLSEGNAYVRKSRRNKELTESQKFIAGKPACLVSIYQCKNENIEKISQLMINAKIPYRCDGLGTKSSRISVCDNRIGYYLLQYGKSHQKCIPFEIKSLPQKYIQIFLDAFLLGDGHKRIKKDYTDRNTYYTSSPQIASDICELLIKIGKRPHMYESKVAGKPVQHKNGIYASNYNVFYITENIGTSVKFSNCKTEDIPYKGKVYDVTLPKNHTLFTKRNNKIWVSSNCHNPSGFVVAEKYPHTGLVTANGHSLEHTKSTNTNFAILVSKIFTAPFNDPTAYVESVCKLANLLSGGGLLVQRLGDLKEGRRSTEKRVAEGNMIPTCEATPGDLSLVIPYRQLLSIMEMLEAMNGVLPGIASKYTLLYGIEAKFYSNNVEIDATAQTKVRNLYVGGDGSGHSRGLNASCVMGLMVAKGLLDAR